MTRFRSISERRKGLLYVLVTALLWGGVLPFCLHISLNYADVTTISWYRFIFSFVFLFLFIVPTKRREGFSLRNKKVLFLTVIAGLALAINYLGYFKGIELTTPGNAQVFIQTSPLMFALMGILFFKEEMSKRKYMGYAIALLGFYFFYRDQISNLLGEQTQYQMGNLAVLGGAFAWAIYAVLNKVAIKSLKPQHINLILYFVAAVALLPFANLAVFGDLSFSTWILFSILGLITVIAYGTLGEAIKRIPATTISIIIVTNPIITLILGTLFTKYNITWAAHEQVNLIGAIGAFLVILGATLVVWKKRQSKN